MDIYYKVVYDRKADFGKNFPYNNINNLCIFIEHLQQYLESLDILNGFRTKNNVK